jgi:release factor glutamine methyltransferase
MTDIIPSIEDALHQAQSQLAVVTTTAHLEAEILLAHALDTNRTWLRTWPERIPAPEQYAHFRQLLARRSRGEPIAYLTGRRAFWDIELQVTPDTLIPRPETEHLVEQALERIPSDAAWHIADLGTGSGAIALAIARERPRCRITATDISPAALDVARDNANRLRIANVHFFTGHWFHPLAGENFEMVLANPPYVHPEDPHLKQGGLRFEPTSALTSYPDGLTDLQTIANTARRHLLPPGWLLMEHGHDQGPAARVLLGSLGYRAVADTKDLAHNARIVLGKWEGHTK